MNRCRIATVVSVPPTINLEQESAPGNVLLTARLTGLAKDSVADVSQIGALDRGQLTERVGKLPASKMDLLLRGIDILLGR